MTEEQIGRLVIALVMLGTGLLLAWMARAAAAGRLKRNALAGIRTPSTMVSDEAWLAAHQRAERPTLWAAACSATVGLICVLPVSEAVALTAVLAGSAVILGFVVYGAVVGGRAARATKD